MYQTDFICTYKNIDDCFESIKYYLAHDEEREEIAKTGQKYVLDNYNYKDLMGKLSEEIKDAYTRKFGQIK